MDDVLTLQTGLLLCLGIGLAAASGFRVFIPPLALGIAQRAELPIVSEAPGWMSSWPALILFGTAAFFEIVAYYVPWLDNLLDTIASPAAVIAGILLTAAVLGDVDPMWQWSFAIIAGGSAAGVTQAATVFTRAVSTGTTGGCANFLVATLELFGAVLFVVLTLLLAPLALALVVGAVIWLTFAWKRRSRRKREAAQVDISPAR